MTGNYSRPRFSPLLECYWLSSLLISFALLPLFCFGKASRERERELFLPFEISLLSILVSTLYRTQQILVITTYIEGNSIFVLGPAETKFMAGKIYQQLKRNISLKRFHCFAFFLEPPSLPLFKYSLSLSPVSRLNFPSNISLQSISFK